MPRAQRRQIDTERVREQAERRRAVAECDRAIAETRRVVTELTRDHAEGARVAQAEEDRVGKEHARLDGTAADSATLGPYSLDNLIGSSDVGLVYRAQHPRLDRQVAIKIYHEGFCSRFTSEARMVAALNHRNICGLYEVGPNYLVMEFVPGRTLAHRLADGALPSAEAIAVTQQIAQGLAAAHREGVIHRDLTPANIKIRPDGVVKVLGFGLPVARAGARAGTLRYMSPEQAQGLNVDLRTDIWSVGVVLHEMLAPVSPGLQRVIDRCLAKNREERYPSCDDLLADLSACARDLTAITAPALTERERRETLLG